jgi:transcriptional regulator with XRE-family HTH domain
MAKDRDPNEVGYPDPIGDRIHRRRLELGLSFAELAKKAGLRTPSYLYYIERGMKIPSEEIARSLARALGDDEDLYVAWARVRQRGDVASAMDASMVLHRALRPGQGRRPGAAADAEEQPAIELPRESMRFASLSQIVRGEPREETSSPSLLVKIPVLPEGSDPGSGRDDEPEPVEVLRVDPRLLKMEGILVRPFAYRLGELGAARVPEQLRAGDLAIVTRNAWPLQPEEVYALRIGGNVVLSQAKWADEKLWAVNHAGDETGESLGSGMPPPALVGRVAVVVRAAGARSG